LTINGNPTEDEFGKKLAKVVSVARPIRSIEHLKGRDQFLDQIRRALYADGRHIFVFGDRGVGKSSLAATAAIQYQSSDASPIFVSGSPDDTFSTIIANVAVQALGRSKTETTRQTSSNSISFRGFSSSSDQEVSALDLADQIKTVSDATELLKQVAAKHSGKPAVVLDEFDTIPKEEDRKRFASLLKQMGDQTINLKFFISGIGQSCEELLGAHQSAHRQLATFELHRLGWEARREIVAEAAAAFGLEVNADVNWRIAMISDGFPYYVHLIVEKMLWEAFTSEAEIDVLSWEHFYDGLRVAIAETNAELRRPYEKAVLQRAPEYEDVVWSTADGEDLIRSTKDMLFSYKRIVAKRQGRPVLDNTKYADILRKLKDASLGSVLQPVAKRKGLYTYTEKMLRGYVRMQAEANHVELSGERPAPRQTMHVGNSRTGAYGPSIPREVDQNRLIGDDEEA
jgi:hypothetical protein